MNTAVGVIRIRNRTFSKGIGSQAIRGDRSKGICLMNKTPLWVEEVVLCRSPNRRGD